MRRSFLYAACLSVLSLGLGAATASAGVETAPATPNQRIYESSRPELLPFVGHYTAADGRNFHVTFGARQDLRAFGAGGVNSLSLKRTGPESFEIVSDQAPGAVRFERSAGEVTALVLAQGGTTTTFRRGPDRFTTREVRYASDIPLTATLYQPLGDGPFPAAVIVHGSGNSNRDSSWYQRVAELLIDAGYAVLVPDKRGSGRSAGDWREVGFDRLAEDSLAAVDGLLAEPTIRRGRIGLVGVSQGGWIAPLAARDRNDIAFVVNLVGSAVRPVEQVALEIENTLRSSGIPEDGIRAVLALQKLGFEYIATGEGADAYLAAFDALAQTPLAAAARELPRDLNSWEVRWWKRVHDFDPIPHWNALCDRPTFVAYGAEDERDNVPVAESVRRLTSADGTPPGCKRTVKVYPGVGHSLSRENVFDPKFRSDIGTWLRAVADGSADVMQK